MTSVRKDRYAGLLVLCIGAIILCLSWSYKIGKLTDMGPGYFPAVLGGAMMVLGLSIMAFAGREFVDESEDGGDFGFDARSWTCIVASVLLFIGLANYAGLAPAAFACVFVAALGDRDVNWKGALGLAAAIAAFGVLLFGYGLGLQLPILRGF